MGNKAKKKDTKIVIGIVGFCVIVLGIFIYTKLTNNGTKNIKGTSVVLSETGEASSINLEIPSINQQSDSLSLLKQYEQFKIDSLNRARITGTNLIEVKGENKKSIGNNRLGNYASDDTDFLNDVKSQLDKDKKVEKRSSNSRSRVKRKNTSNYNKRIRNNSRYNYTRSKENTNTSKNIQTQKTSINKEAAADWRKRIEKENTDFYNSKTANSTFSEKNNTASLVTDQEILAVVYRNQKVIDKGRVSIRLAQNCIINGIKYKRNTVFFGFAKFSPNRVYVTVNSINNTPVNLKVYDSGDYGEGIYTETQFKNIVKDDIENDVVDDVNVSGIPLGKTVKNIFKKDKRKDVAPLFNEYKLILKPY